jgi:hypothetical protein
MISIILGLYVGILGIPFIERVSSPLYDFIVVTQRTTLCNLIAYEINIIYSLFRKTTLRFVSGFYTVIRCHTYQ